MATNESDSVFNITDADLNFEATQTNETPELNTDALKQALIGEGKKYKTEADAIQSLVFKEMHIKKIEEENRLLRQSATETKTVDQILQALKSTNGSQNTVQDIVRDNQNVDANNNAPVASVEEVSRKVLEALEAKTEAKKQEENISKVKAALLSNFGADFPNVLENKATELGLDKATIDMMAKKTPQALLKLLDVKANVSTNPSPNNSYRVPEGVNTEKNAAYYAKLRKSNPNLYYSRNIQNEIIQQAEKLGQKFYS
jgi:hypothetical protein